jgi:hypothetical protein
MLLIARTTEALPAEERDLRDLIRTFPRTALRPTNQWSAELKGAALTAFAAPCILDDEEDIPFSPVPDLPGTPDTPRPTPASSAPSIPPYPRSPQGDSAMHIQQFHPGGCLLSLSTTDLALLALVLRHAASNPNLLRLAPLMPTTLDSLASAFETGTLMGLQQSGHLQTAPDTPLTAEQVQAWCQCVVVGGIDKRPAPTYSVTSANPPGPTKD